MWRAITLIAALLAAAIMWMATGVPALAEERVSEPSKDLCRLLTKAEVSRALGMQIVRAEAPDTQLAGCDYSARGSAADMTASHTTQFAKGAASASGSSIDGPTEKLIDTFGKLLLKGSAADTPSTARHPGEVSVFSFAIQLGDAEDQMRASRRTVSNIGGAAAVTPVANLGEEAFDSGGAMLSVRKGKRMVQFTYASCACTTREIIPLARKVVDQL